MFKGPTLFDFLLNIPGCSNVAQVSKIKAKFQQLNLNDIQRLKCFAINREAFDL